jgi:hypothetical protein
MKLSIVINCDTRPNAGDDFHCINNYGSGNLCGVHSLDFLTHGVIAKNRYLEGCNRETILCVDLHDPIPVHIKMEIDRLIIDGEINRIITWPHSKEKHRWNDDIYVRSLREVSSDATHIAHWDGDCIGYKREGVNIVEKYLSHLANGYKYVCQQTPLDNSVHGMFWASSRFFFCEKSTLDLDEVERCLDDKYRSNKLPEWHLPCMEHILGALSGEGSVLYPPSDDYNFCVWSWVHYYAGTIKKLNSMSYDEVKKYVFEDCGGLLGASDMIGKPL